MSTFNFDSFCDGLSEASVNALKENGLTNFDSLQDLFENFNDDVQQLELIVAEKGRLRQALKKLFTSEGKITTKDLQKDAKLNDVLKDIAKMEGFDILESQANKPQTVTATEEREEYNYRIMASSLIDDDHNYKTLSCIDDDHKALSCIDDELRIVMVGKTGAGKSALGNNLLQSKKFKSSTLAISVTIQCNFGTRLLDNGKKMVIVDTPGIFDTSKKNVETTKEVVRCIGLASPGPHIFVFVLKIGRFTEEEMNTIQHLKDLFGEEVVNYVIIVFTGKDSLDDDSLTIDEYIEQSPEELQSLVGQCQGRIAINNRAKPPTNDIKAILDLMDEIVRKHDGGYYTGVMFEGAERAYQEKLKSLEEEKHKKEWELERRAQEIEKDAKQKMQEINDMKLENDKKEEEFKRIKVEQDKKEKEITEEREKLKNVDPRQEYRKDVQTKSEDDGPIVRIARGIESIGGGLVNVPGAALSGLWKGITGWL